DGGALQTQPRSQFFLSSKSNQFKLTTRRSSEAEIAAQQSDTNALTMRKHPLWTAGYPVALGARIIRANGRQARSTGPQR
ncbi:MAG TPA: hypothetical protein VE396_16245, partial [Xanthobacteraceae bacterium]|nr:hypothetical protein [Xanthobacteraceae bacterium]